MYDICNKYIKNIVPVYLYYVKGLSYREDFIKYYEDKYGREIVRLPHPELALYKKNNVFGCGKAKDRENQEVSLSENDNILRRQYNVSYIAYGYKKTDSLSRRGMIWHGDGIDERNKKIFPVADFSNKDIMYYVKKNKLLLPPEYKDGYRDINNFFEKRALTWLISRYPNDYEALKTEYPLIDSVLYKEGV